MHAVCCFLECGKCATPLIRLNRLGGEEGFCSQDTHATRNFRLACVERYKARHGDGGWFETEVKRKDSKL